MEPLDMGPIYEEIGRLIAEDVRSDPEGAFLYTEVKKGLVSCSIFKDVGKKVIYRRCSEDLTDKIYDTWWSLKGKHRWASMSYTISRGRFRTTFEYPDDWMKGETLDDRLPRVLFMKYGSKLIEYSDP